MVKMYIDSKNQNKRYDVTEIVTSTNISFYKSGTASKLEFTVLKDDIVIYHEGDAVYFYDEDMPIFKGYIFTKTINEKNEIKTTAYDQLRYLKAKGTYQFIGKSLSDIIKIIANHFQLKTGYIEEIPYKVPEHYHEDESMFDIIEHHLQEAKLHMQTELVFYDNFGELTLKRADDMISKYVLGYESFVTGYDYTTDIDSNTYNVIKLIQPNEVTKAGDKYIAIDETNIKRWGMLQYYEVVNENMNAAQIIERLKMLSNYYNKVFRTLSLNAIGIPGLRGGNTIYIDIPNIGDISINKSLLIDSVTHKYKHNDHTMTLELEVR